MKLTKYLLLLGLIYLCACEEDNFHSSEPDYFGSWANPVYTDSTVILDRVVDLSMNSYGFSIRENGVFIEKKNSGFCGTPPISYDVYQGSWIKADDQTLLIESESWMGKEMFRLKIMKLTGTRIEVSFEYLRDEGLGN